MFTHSVCSYPQRGNYGKSGYRGNCTGYIIRDFVESYLAPEGLFADPSIGSGTSSDVAEEMGIRFKGTDLHQGYNLLTQDFAAFLGEQANLIWWHPPYWNMIRYSGNQWGDAANPWDLSQMDLEQFQEAMLLAMMNIHDATEQGGHYGILMGNMRKDGRYYNLSSMVERMAAGRLVDEIIKIQHNCVSDSRQYGGKLVRIRQWCSRPDYCCRCGEGTSQGFRLPDRKAAPSCIRKTQQDLDVACGCLHSPAIKTESGRQNGMAFSARW